MNPEDLNNRLAQVFEPAPEPIILRPFIGSDRACTPTVGRPPLAVLGVRLDNLTLEEALAKAEEMLLSGKPHYLVTANVDFLVQAQEDVELRRIFFDADLVVCDGMPLVWASRLLGNRLPERVAGADLVPLLIRAAATKGYRLFLLGASPEAAERAVGNLKAAHPELKIVGHYSPPFGTILEMDHHEVRRRLLEAKPDLLLVAFGCPKQEKWIAMHYRSLGVPLSAGVGGTIDFLAGRLKRAPGWVQHIGAEWLFRLIQEPRRLFRRYVKDLFVFGRCLVRQWWVLKLQKSRSRKAIDKNMETPSQSFIARLGQSESWQWFRLPERFDVSCVMSDPLLADGSLADGRHCLLDASQVRFLDSTGVGRLIRLSKQVDASGAKLVLVSPGGAVLRVLNVMHLKEFFLLAPDVDAAHNIIRARTREETATVALRVAADSSTLMWRGEITAANAKAVWKLTHAHLAGVLGSNPCKLDLSAVRFIDSTGLGLLIRAKKLARKQNVPLVLVGIQPAVRNVLKLARMEEFLLEAAPA